MENKDNEFTNKVAKEETYIPGMANIRLFYTDFSSANKKVRNSKLFFTEH